MLVGFIPAGHRDTFRLLRLVVGGAGPFPNTEKVVDSNDSQMQQVVLANGKLWAALDTGLLVDGDSTPRACIASEYVNQTCTYNTWLATNFRCGNTRTQLGNWGTRISKIVP